MKRRNRWVAWMMAICLGMGSLGGCGLDEEEVTTEDPGSGTEDPDTPSDGTVRGGVPTDLQVNRSTGEMSITRNSFGDTPMGEDGTWTIFVYLCGADIQSDAPLLHRQDGFPEHRHLLFLRQQLIRHRRRL